MRGRLACLAAVLLASCRSAERPATAGVLEVSVSIESSALNPREGDLATAAFRLRNASDRVVVLRDLAPPGAPSGGSVMTWQFAQAGLLQYLPDRDDWIYDRRRPADRPRPVFNSGLLLPSESIVVRARIRLLGLPRDLALTYFDLSRADVTQMVYFETRVDREVRFRRLVGEELNVRMTPEAQGDVSGHRVVVFPYAEQVVPTCRRRTVRVEAAVEPRPFGLAAALRKAGLPAADEHTYSCGLDGWVLRKGEVFWLATPSAATPLPRLRQAERTFHYLDAVGAGKFEVEFLRETKSVFAEKYRVVADQRGRYFAFIPGADLLPFLLEVRDAGLAVDVEVTPEGGGRLTVTR